ncbi:MAG: hypothetical protein II955_04510 [Clostridia bacterium]|nr:hypothetical protein [Clostridia bacterium]
MKTATKRFLSVLLTVFMFFGTVALAIPAMVVTASADASYTDVPANTTVKVNGINVRYDRYDGNNDGYVHVFADGTIELKIRHGDMVWFPDLVMTNSSEVHVEVTVLEGTDHFNGFAFNVASDGAGSWASANIAAFLNGSRVRVAGDTKANLGGYTNNSNNNEGYGGKDGMIQINIDNTMKAVFCE